MAVTLDAQSPISVDEARRYLLDQGFPTDDFDMLRIHINAITSLILNVTGLPRIRWIDGDTVTEYRDGLGDSELWLKGAPVRAITGVTLHPNRSSATETLTVPTGSDLASDDLFFDPDEGLLVLKRKAFPEGRKAAKIEYECGYYDGTGVAPNDTADSAFNGFKAIALDALATKWHRFKNQRHGVDSETKQETTVTYTTEDFTAHAMRDLRRFRRALFA